MTRPNWFQRFVRLEPALLRGILVAVVALVAQVVGYTIEDELVDSLIDLFTAFSAIVAALAIRPAVTANAKVVVWDNTPLTEGTDLRSGEATVDAVSDAAQEELLFAARVAG